MVALLTRDGLVRDDLVAAEACQQFLAVNLQAAQQRTKLVAMGPCFQSLADALRTSDPTFSAEMQKDLVTAWVVQLRAASG